MLKTQFFLQVGMYNSTGQKYRGHYSIWTTNTLQERLVLLKPMLINPHLINRWVNGNLYIQTQESIGILPIPMDVRIASGMTEYHPNLDGKRRHHYLAMMQGTQKAILPVHLAKEHQLFRTFMSTNQAFNSRSKGPDWKEAPRVWNQYADNNDEIYYKVNTLVQCVHICHYICYLL
jgi:hypothetical protein